ncbi:MAG: LysM peptidoglycan-binding domain-containing protein [Thiotrichales bacterium]|nr:LysM peptidoglycan-binding domain-containing protein [Thiotrichales bacterium]
MQKIPQMTPTQIPANCALLKKSMQPARRYVLWMSLGVLALPLSGCNSLTALTQPSEDRFEAKYRSGPSSFFQTPEEQDSPDRHILHLGSKPELKKAIEAQYGAQMQSPQIPTARRLNPNNLWDQFQGQFKLAQDNQAHYEKSVLYYQKRQQHLTEVSKRAKPYLYYIVQEVKRRQMPLELALLPMIESGFQPHAKSHQEALGLWQFMPQTALMLGLEKNAWYDGRRDLLQSTQAALTYLQRHYDNTQDWLLSLASYNAGFGTVQKAIKTYQQDNATQEMPDFWQLRAYLPKETQNYVPSLLSLAHLIDHNDRYQITLEEIPNRPFFEVLQVDRQVALNAVANAAQISNELLSNLNPAYVRQATPPNGPHTLLLPISKKQQVQKMYQRNAQAFAINWQDYRVKAGDSLGKIALQFGTSITEIKQLNHLASNSVRTGQKLLIPVLANSHLRPDDASLLASIRQNDSTVNMAANALLTSPKNQQTPKQKSTSFSEYQVVAGDTLSTIAEKLGVSTQKLAQWNRLSIQSKVRVGQVLKISTESNQAIRHSVKAGESLSEIANHYGVTVKQLMQWNQIRSTRALQTGQTLSVWQGPQTSKHAEYRVKNGDNLWVIAKEFRLPVQSLAQYNQLSIQSMLQPGQILKIPFNI